MDELSKSFSAAEGMVAAEQSGKPKRHNEFCLNCGMKLMEVFCHHCGQKDLPKRQTLGELLANFISSFWSYEGKFLLTAKYLINQKYKDNLTGFGKDFGKAFMDNFSKILFFLLPVFALILKLLYIRRDFFYSEHLVFSIYYYNFVYLTGSLYMLINLVPALGWLATLIGFWIFVYLLISMKRMYEQSWRKTIFKYFIFLFVFLLSATLGIGVNALFILLMI